MRSQAQRAFLHIHHPKIADRWEKETPPGKLPKHVRRESMSDTDGPTRDDMVNSLGASADDPPSMREVFDGKNVRFSLTLDELQYLDHVLDVFSDLEGDMDVDERKKMNDIWDKVQRELRSAGRM